MTLTVTDWIAWDDAEGKPEAPIGGFGGYFEDGMRWPDLHLARLPHALALRDATVPATVNYAEPGPRPDGLSIAGQAQPLVCPRFVRKLTVRRRKL